MGNMLNHPKDLKKTPYCMMIDTRDFLHPEASLKTESAPKLILAPPIALLKGESDTHILSLNIMVGHGQVEKVENQKLQ